MPYDLWAMIAGALGLGGFALLAIRKPATAGATTAGATATGAQESKTVPRGIRNNNPGNLIIDDRWNWKGKLPRAENTDGKFEQFEHPIWGIRAMFIDLRGDIEKDGLNTIEKLISSYAPAWENNTAAYVASVAQQTGLPPGALLLPEFYLPLIKAIIRHENGIQPYSDSLIAEAMALA